MSDEKEVLTGGYQPSEFNEQRGYQPNGKFGYQPNNKSSTPPPPPPSGSNAVTKDDK